MKIITEITASVDTIELLDNSESWVYIEDGNWTSDILEMRRATHEIRRANDKLAQAQEGRLDIAACYYRLALIRNRLKIITSMLYFDIMP